MTSSILMSTIFLLSFIGHAASLSPTMSPSPSAPISNIYQLTNNPFGAKCLDGSSPVYYYEAGFGSGINKWIFNYEGGGYCQPNAQVCYNSIKTNSYFTSGDVQVVRPYHNFTVDPFTSGTHGIFLSANPTYNPQLYNYNKVFLHYCSQDLWMGNRLSSIPVNQTAGTKIYFMGNLISQAILADVFQRFPSIVTANTVIVSGGSAGAFGGSYHKLDTIRAMFPLSTIVGIILYFILVSMTFTSKVAL